MFRQLFKKEQFDDSEWNGSASNWETADAYCADCLIDTNPSGEEKTKDRCHLPYRKPGSKAINKAALRTMATGRGLLALKDVPASEIRKAAQWVARMWPKAFEKPAPDSILRAAKEQRGSYVTFVKSGEDIFFLGIYSNKFEDRDREILTAAAHQKYVNRLKATGFKPVVTVHHQPKINSGLLSDVYLALKDRPDKLSTVIKEVFKTFAIGQVERAVYLNGFVAVVAKVFDDKRHIAEKLAEFDDLGMSHGFFILEQNGKFIEDYHSFEMSVLRRSRAANVLTSANIFRRNKMGNISKEDRDFLSQLFGEEVVDSLDEDTERAENLLSQIRAYKEADETGETPESDPIEDKVETAPVEDKAEAEEAPEDEEEDEEMSPTEKKEIDTETIVAAVLEALDAEGLKEVVTNMAAALDTAVTELGAVKKELADSKAAIEAVQKSQDEALAEEIAPRFDWRGISVAGSRPSAASATVVSKTALEEEFGLDLTPGDQQANKAEKMKDDPLYLGFYSLFPGTK